MITLVPTVVYTKETTELQKSVAADLKREDPEYAQAEEILNGDTGSKTPKQRRSCKLCGKQDN